MRTNRILPRALKIGVLALGFALMLGIDTAAACARDNGGLTLPEGLCATIFADNLGPTRHLAVTDDSTVYVNTWRSPYKKDAKIPAGGFLVALRDGNGDGVA